MSISMGRATFGRSAGKLWIYQEQPSLALASPTNLFYTAMSRTDVEVIQVNGLLRQIKALQALADIVIINNYKYDIRFYLLSQVGSKVGGVYQLTGSPYVTWTIENPDASPTVFNRLRVTETRGGDVKVYDYVYTDATKTWVLTTPGSIREDDIVWATSGGSQNRTYTGTVKTPGGPSARPDHDPQLLHDSKLHGERIPRSLAAERLSEWLLGEIRV